jgi:hypothetical protein
MALKEIVLESVDWIHLVQNREQCLAVEHGNDPSGSINY